MKYFVGFVDNNHHDVFSRNHKSKMGQQKEMRRTP